MEIKCTFAYIFTSFAGETHQKKKDEKSKKWNVKVTLHHFSLEQKTYIHPQRCKEDVKVALHPLTMDALISTLSHPIIKT